MVTQFNGQCRSGQLGGYYWTGSPSGNNGYMLLFNAGTTNQYSSRDASDPSGGFSACCVKEIKY